MTKFRGLDGDGEIEKLPLAETIYRPRAFALLQRIFPQECAEEEEEEEES